MKVRQAISTAEPEIAEFQARADELAFERAMTTKRAEMARTLTAKLRDKTVETERQRKEANSAGTAADKEQFERMRCFCHKTFSYDALRSAYERSTASNSELKKAYESSLAALRHRTQAVLEKKRLLDECTRVLGENVRAETERLRLREQVQNDANAAGRRKEEELRCLKEEILQRQAEELKELQDQMNQKKSRYDEVHEGHGEGECGSSKFRFKYPPSFQ